jgi:uncharacterized protein (TIGR00369 family)
VDEFFGGDKAGMIERLNAAMIAAVPLNAALKFQAVDLAPGTATVRLPYREELVGNPATGVIHGGAITALLDATCGLAVFLKMTMPSRIATLDLRIDYLKPATPPRDVHAKAECYKLTRQVAFVRATAYHEDPDDPIASAAGTFMVFDDSRSPVARAIRKT